MAIASLSTAAPHNNSSGNCRFDKRHRQLRTFVGSTAPADHRRSATHSRTLRSPIRLRIIPAWRAAITAIYVNGTQLTNTARNPLHDSGTDCLHAFGFCSPYQDERHQEHRDLCHGLQQREGFAATLRGCGDETFAPHPAVGAFCQRRHTGRQSSLVNHRSIRQRHRGGAEYQRHRHCSGRRHRRMDADGRFPPSQVATNGFMFFHEPDRNGQWNPPNVAGAFSSRLP